MILEDICSRFALNAHTHWAIVCSENLELIWIISGLKLYIGCIKHAPELHHANIPSSLSTDII